MRLATLLINLDNATARLKKMDRQLQALGLEFERVAAISGEEAQKNLEREFDTFAYTVRVGKKANMNEIGCHLSHLKAMEVFLKSEATHCLILEDDAILPDDINGLIEEAVSIGGDWDILRLSSSRKGVYLPVAKLGKDRQLSVNTRVLKNTAGYVINRRAAEACLNKLRPMCLPYDVAIDRDWHLGLRTLCVLPFPVTSPDAPGQIPRAPRLRLWRSTTFHLLHLVDHISRRIYRKGVHHDIMSEIGPQAD